MTALCHAVRRIVLTSAVVLLCLAGASRAGASTVYSASENPTWFGWLDQYSLGGTGTVGLDACSPTSTTNAMTYLQNAAPAMFGTALTGASYSDWQATDTLLTDSAYMNTQIGQGTYAAYQFYGTSKYITETKGFSQVIFAAQVLPGTDQSFWSPPFDVEPAYVQNVYPTWNFIFQALTAGTATIFTIEYEHGGGHCLLAQSLQWTDANGDGVIDKSENATLSFVDPLDPAFYGVDNQPSSGAKITSGHVWNSQGTLQLDYLQYWGQLPYASSNYGHVKNATIDTVLSIAVPVPEMEIDGGGAVVAMLLATLGLLEGRRRGTAV